EPQAQTVAARAPAPAKPHSLTALDEADGAPLVRDRPMTLHPPLGAWRGYLAMLLLAANALSFALLAYVEVERVLLIHAEADAEKAQVAEVIRNVHQLGRRPLKRAQPVDHRAVVGARWREWLALADNTNILLHATLWPALVAFLIWLGRAYYNLARL